MFNSKTERIKKLAELFPARVTELEGIFGNSANIYIDYANVRPWANKLGWHIDLKRLKQFLDSFEVIQSIKFYSGKLKGDFESESLQKEIEGLGYDLRTKPVKVMKLSIDISSIPADSPALLKEFIRKPLLQKFQVETVTYLNQKLKELNQQGIFYIEDLKCNFDVEIGRDMLLDYERNTVESFILWSGDSDFADPIQQLLNDGKKVAIFATARRVAAELNELTKQGLLIFDIQKIRNFICWKKEINKNVLL
ncbi:MAG: NYN domain-containing protein [Candidatus Pacebacteria bacterium]|nr:NYN domain-containing protein [Candidatus Paceibacterota bacterium]